jgi:glutamate synthase (NADPH/NADH) small chain
MRPGDPDSSGRRSPVETGERFILETDMLIKAAGQEPFASLVSENSIENDHGRIKLNEDLSTNLKGVFAGGDAVNGGKEVVDAVQAGKLGANAILNYLF